MKLVCHALIAIFVTACAKAPPSTTKDPADSQIQHAFVAAEKRLATEFLENGWVVSRHQDGTPDHQGDSLIWTGLWLGAASCEAGNSSEQALLGSIRELGGGIRRYPGIDDASLDGALGLYRGIIERVKRCPDSRQAWLDVMTLHLNYVESNDGRLTPNSNSRLIPEFDYVLVRLLGNLSGSGDSGRDNNRLNRLMGESVAWATAVVASHKSAFRIHLVLLALQTLEAVGETIPPDGRNTLCAATRGVNMPTLDQWCGEHTLSAWIDAYKHNEWEYRHQRAGKWETPDGNGLQTPGLDVLVAIRQAYSL